MSLKFYFKFEEEQIKTCIIGKGFISKKMYFDLNKDSHLYVLNDFFGRNKELNFELSTESNPILAIITPSMRRDASGSYCEVANSGIAPEKLGERFNIPQCFLISIKFK